MITETKRVTNWRQIRKCEACQRNIEIGQQKIVVETFCSVMIDTILGRLER